MIWYGDQAKYLFTVQFSRTIILSYWRIHIIRIARSDDS